jgi:hypothetical protein
MKGFIFLMVFSLFNFSFAGDLTEGGGGGRIKEPTITRGSMVMEKSNGLGIEKPVVEPRPKGFSIERVVNYPLNR